MFHASIAGTGRAVPAGILTNADLSRMVATSDEWIRTRTGISERHRAAEGEVLSDFCAEASRQALEAAGLLPKELDTIIVATVRQGLPAASRGGRSPAALLPTEIASTESSRSMRCTRALLRVWRGVKRTTAGPRAPDLPPPSS